MVGRVSLLDRALGDLKNARNIVKQYLSDEVQLDIAAYHVQQGIEKSLKYFMAGKKIEFKKTHEIKILLDQLDKVGIEYPEWLYLNEATITSFAEETRFGEPSKATQRKLLELLELAEQFASDIQQQLQQQERSTILYSNNLDNIVNNERT